MHIKEVIMEDGEGSFVYGDKNSPRAGDVIFYLDVGKGAG